MRHVLRRSLVPVVAIALLATACSADPKSSRGASAAPGDPMSVPALAAGPTVPEGTPRAPIFPGAVVSSTNGIATSVSPTIVADGAKGATSFDIRDLSTGTTGFHRQYSSSSPSQRIPEGAGLADGGVYVWTATDATGAKFGGSFQVDLAVTGVQAVDTIGGVTSGLSSGAATFSWESHAMNSLPGGVGFGLHYSTTNAVEAGVPAGWDLRGASSSPYARLIVHDDGSVALMALDGSSTTYRPGTGGAYAPVVLSGDLVGSGSAPVLTHNADGTWTVLNKQSASTFSAAGTNGVADLRSVDTSDKPMLGQSWSDGVLRSISDPVSGRSVEFIHGGGDCGPVGPGFIAAPKGLLCRVKFWDGSTSSIQYISMPDGTAQIGRLIDFPEAKGEGALVSDIAYDSIGRISSTRAPLAVAAIAAGLASADDASLTASFVYDDQGRVATATGQAPTVGGTRDTRTYQYLGSRSTAIADSNFGGIISTVVFDPANFRILSSTDAAGLTATNEYDPTTGQLVRRVDRNGNVTVNTYDNGRLVETRGPTEGSLATDATDTRYSYDQTFATSPEGTPMMGLDVSYWATADWTGRVVADEVGPMLNGVLAPSLAVNWTESPTGSSSWSARMLGALQVDTAGDYSVDPSGNAKVWIDSVSCAANGCHGLPLGAGSHQIRIDVSSTTSEGSMSVMWSGPDTAGSPVAIATRSLRPQYGYITTVKGNDELAAGVVSEAISHTQYADPGRGQVSAKVSQSGAVSKLDYQPLTGRDGNWGRQSSTTAPSGTVVSLGYWGDRESVKASCPSAKSANQGGLPKDQITEGAPAGSQSTTTIRDAAGRVVSSAISGGATTCTTYDSGGRMVRVDTLGMGRTESVVTDYGTDGDPLVTTRTTTTGDVVTTKRVVSDLLGRPVSITDDNGIVETISYDRATGKTSRVTLTAPSGATTTQVNTYDPQTRLARIDIDGRMAATVTYGPDGNEQSIAYGNGVHLDLGYDVSNRLDSLRWTTADGHVATSSRTISAGGRILGSSVSSDSRTSSWAYTYDDARHLATASVSAGLVGAHSYAYTYDAASNRTAQTVDGTTSTYAYDEIGRLTSSTDPMVGSLAYDALGDVTKLGADTFTYDANRAMIGATDGATTVAYDRDATGSIVAKTTTDASGSSVIRYAIGDLTLDANGAPMWQDSALPGGVTLTHAVGSNGASKWGLADVAGNRLATTSDAGSLVGVVQVYEPFGTPLTVADVPAKGQNDLTWLASTGNETQPLKVGYQLMGARTYVPTIGRFLQVDPKPGGSANAYDFADQDPVNLRDSSGQSFSDWISAIVVAVVSIALTPFTGGGSVLIGAAIGLAVGAAGYVLDWGIRSAIDGEMHHFDVAQFAITAGIGAVFGAFGGALGKFRRRPTEPVPEGVDVGGPGGVNNGRGVSAEIVERRSTTVSEVVDQLENAEAFHNEWLKNIERNMGMEFAEMTSYSKQGLKMLAERSNARIDAMQDLWFAIDTCGPERTLNAFNRGKFTQLEAAIDALY